jgi:hypothetical protein
MFWGIFNTAMMLIAIDEEGRRGKRRRPSGTK